MKQKKGAIDETSSGETSTTMADVFHYLKIILIVGLLLLYLIVPGMRYINSKAPVPDTLHPDLLVERLANLCFASPHEGFENVIDQKVISVNKVNKQQIKNCFGQSTKNPVNRVTLTWRENSGNKNIDIVLVDKISKQNVQIPVMVKTKNGLEYPGFLGLEK